ncbi:MAG: fibronectin type III domain-containing protein [Ignavibacteriae bacterium]|nr:fibronectin type III domain-containing protein [Ignavibacteria bacterium]MBI3364368.1 fibronectin type III domain-containing protein [Ignavibacteriota bacterium]
MKKLYLSIASGILFFGILQPALSQSSGVTFRIRVSDDGAPGDSGLMVFGNHPNATYGIDAALGENASPPDPPGFYAKWISIPGRPINSATGLLYKDLRDTPSPLPSTRKDSFYIRVKNDYASATNANLAIKWPDPAYILANCDSMILEFTDTTGGIGSGIPGARVNMSTTSSVTIKNPFDQSGWNPAAPYLTIKIFKYGFKYYICECWDSTIPYTDSASTITSTLATLNGYIHFGCDPIDSATFQYGTTTSYGMEIHADTSNFSSFGISYTATLTNLIPNTTYHYRIAAHLRSNCSGEPGNDYGADQTFTTDPPSSIFQMRISDNSQFGVDSTHMVFGNHIYATYGIDYMLGENPFPPVPPGFYAKWINIPSRDISTYSSTGLLYKDLRDVPINPAKKDSFYLKVKNDDAAADSADVILSWPDSSYIIARCDSMILQFTDPTGGTGSGIPGSHVNMTSTNLITIKTPYHFGGWNPAAPALTLKIFKYGTKMPLVDAVKQQDNDLPHGFALYQNYPNPFNPVTHFQFSIA